MKIKTGLLFFVLSIAALWIAGPPPLETDGYVQSVTSSSAVICKVDPAPTLRGVWVSGPGLSEDLVIREQSERTLHALTVTGLSASTKYTYGFFRAAEQPKNRDNKADGSFQTPPADDSEPVRFATVGDSGAPPWWLDLHEYGWGWLRPGLAWTDRPKQWEIAEWIANEQPQFFLHLGDLVYSDHVWGAQNEVFFLPFRPVLRTSALYSLIGNHDVPENGTEPPFEKLFHHPSRPAASQRQYSLVWGSVRIVALDAEYDQWMDPDSLAWLEQTLASATEPWLIVAIHKPCFSVYRDEDANRRDVLWPLLTEHGVDLVLSGDDHHYARFKRASPDSPVQIIAGGGGKDVYDFDTDDPRLAASKKAFSFLRIDAEGLVLRGEAIGASREVYDSFVIDRTSDELADNIHPARRHRIMQLRKH